MPHAAQSSDSNPGMDLEGFGLHASLDSIIPLSSDLPSNSDLEIMDLERERLKLMAHYTLHTSATLAHLTSSNAKNGSIWSEWMAELALDCDFLLHGVLGLSALHLTLLDKERPKNIVLAIQHHDRGVALFRPHLSDIVHNNYDAIIAFACVIIAFAFGIHRVSEPEEGEDIIAKFCRVLTLIRYSSVIVKADYAAVLRSRWATVLAHKPQDVLLDLSNEEQETIARLHLRASQFDTQKAATYITAVETLANSLRNAHTYPLTEATLTSFAIMCPTEFWDAVEEGREPLALAVLANYAVILHWQRENIWMGSWGKDVVDAIAVALPEEWFECISWAREQVALT